MSSNVDGAKKNLDAAVAALPSQDWTGKEADIVAAARAAGNRVVTPDFGNMAANNAALIELGKAHLAQVHNGGPMAANAVAQAQRQIAAQSGTQGALTAGEQGGQYVSNVATTESANNLRGASTANANAAAARLQQLQLQLQVQAQNMANHLRGQGIANGVGLAREDRQNQADAMRVQAEGQGNQLTFASDQDNRHFYGQLAGAGLNAVGQGLGLATQMGAFRPTGGPMQLTDPSQTFGASMGPPPMHFADTPTLAPPTNPFTGTAMANMPSASSWGSSGLSEGLGTLQAPTSWEVF